MKTIADHILDICQNSIRAESTLIEVMIEENKYSDIYKITVSDNGKGMDVQTLKKAEDPFFTSRKTRKVGMGLALLKQNAEASNGKIKIESQPGKGTLVKATFGRSHFDRPPAGELADTFILLMIGNENLMLKFSYKTDQGTFEISSSEIRDALGGNVVFNRNIRQGISELIENNLNKIEAEK